jgi:hypothetical protein
LGSDSLTATAPIDPPKKPSEMFCQVAGAVHAAAGAAEVEQQRLAGHAGDRGGASAAEGADQAVAHRADEGFGVGGLFRLSEDGRGQGQRKQQGKEWTRGHTDLSDEGGHGGRRGEREGIVPGAGAQSREFPRGFRRQVGESGRL